MFTEFIAITALILDLTGFLIYVDSTLADLMTWTMTTFSLCAIGGLAYCCEAAILAAVGGLGGPPVGPTFLP